MILKNAFAPLNRFYAARTPLVSAQPKRFTK